MSDTIPTPVSEPVEASSPIAAAAEPVPEADVAPQAEVQAVETFPVYLVFSPMKLGSITDLIEKYGDVGPARIVYQPAGPGQDPQETDRTIVVTTPEAYQGLLDAGYGDRKKSRNFRIEPFVLTDRHFPGQGQLRTLFVPVPDSWSNDSTGVEEVINNKLEYLADWGIISSKSWTLTVPLKSRATGEARGCYIKFDNNVSLAARAMTRLLLTDTLWPEQEGEQPFVGKKGKGNTLFNKFNRAVFLCYWTRETIKPEAAQREAGAAAPAEGQKPQRPTQRAASPFGPVGSKKPFFKSEAKQEQSQQAAPPAKKQDLPKQTTQPQIKQNAWQPKSKPSE
jgi:hypothetical protein